MKYNVYNADRHKSAKKLQFAKILRREARVKKNFYEPWKFSGKWAWNGPLLREEAGRRTPTRKRATNHRQSILWYHAVATVRTGRTSVIPKGRLWLEISQ